MFNDELQDTLQHYFLHFANPTGSPEEALGWLDAMRRNYQSDPLLTPESALQVVQRIDQAEQWLRMTYEIT